MGKKAKNVADPASEGVSETKDKAKVEAAPAAEATDTTKPAKKAKGKKALAVDDATDKKAIVPAEDSKEIFEEKSAVAKQFEEGSGEPKEEITEERTYIVPLSRAYGSPPNYRAKKAVIILREFFKRHMKATEVKILSEVNELMWERGIESPPRKLKIRATKSIEGVVTLYLSK
jgi:ribosomal protein L31E